jgi:hypothetical protein
MTSRRGIAVLAGTVAVTACGGPTSPQQGTTVPSITISDVSVANGGTSDGTVVITARSNISSDGASFVLLANNTIGVVVYRMFVCVSEDGATFVSTCVQSGGAADAAVLFAVAGPLPSSGSAETAFIIAFLEESGSVRPFERGDRVPAGAKASTVLPWTIRWLNSSRDM